MKEELNKIIYEIAGTDFEGKVADQILDLILDKIVIEPKDWTVDTDDENNDFIRYNDGRTKLVGDEWGIICFLHKEVRKVHDQIKEIKRKLRAKEHPTCDKHRTEWCDDCFKVGI